METRTPQKYRHIIYVLVKGGTGITRKLFEERVRDLTPADQSKPWTVDEFLFAKGRKLLRSKADVDLVRSCFPDESQRTDLNTWNLYMFCFVLNEVCDLRPQIRKNIDGIISLRNELDGFADRDMPDWQYSHYMDAVEEIFDNLLMVIYDETLTREINNLMCLLNTGADHISKEATTECKRIATGRRQSTPVVSPRSMSLTYAYRHRSMGNDNPDMKGVLPTEILKMHKHSIDIYQEALAEGEEIVYQIRVMVVGHCGVGKTTLTKRLFGEDFELHRTESTNGIDVHIRRCKISLDTGEWNVYASVGQKRNSPYKRLSKIYRERSKIHEHVDDMIYVRNSTGTDFQGAIRGGIDGTTQGLCSNIQKFESIAEESNAREKSTVNSHMPSKEVQEFYIKSAPTGWVSDGKDKEEAELSIWDFAGQFAFYNTHQVFLSRRAIYLLVTNMSKHLHDLVEEDECYIDCKNPKYCKISDYVDFWLNSIHEFCGSASNNEPPVILVGTFADEIKEKKKEKSEAYFYSLRSLLVDKISSCHLTETDFSINNTINDHNIEMLRSEILRIASTQSYWGERVPAKWITLEKRLEDEKDDGVKVIGKSRLGSLNRTLPVPIESEGQLELFLLFHHEAGNIIYYRVEGLEDSILLDPQWLIDAFKCLITARMFCMRKTNVLKLWKEFDDSAILKRELIDFIWNKDEHESFNEHKEMLLKFMEQFGLIAKPKQRENEFSSKSEEFFFAPCVLKSKPDEMLISPSVESSNCHSSSILCYSSPTGFMASAVFNKLLAACLTKWHIAKSQDKYLIFCGLGVFDIDATHVLSVRFIESSVQIWVTRYSERFRSPDINLCAEIKYFIETNLHSHGRLSDVLHEHIKCQIPCPSSSRCDCLFRVDYLQMNEEIHCTCCGIPHVVNSSDLLQFWFSPNSYPERNDLKVLEDKALGTIASRIGVEYPRLGFELSLTQADIDHIVEDKRTAVDRITAMLMLWKRKNGKKATSRNLKIAMQAINMDVTTVLGGFN